MFVHYILTPMGMAWLATSAMHLLCNAGPHNTLQFGASAASLGVHSTVEVYTMPGWIGSQLGKTDWNMVISGPAGFGKTWFLNERVIPGLYARWVSFVVTAFWTKSVLYMPQSHDHAWYVDLSQQRCHGNTLLCVMLWLVTVQVPSGQACLQVHADWKCQRVPECLVLVPYSCCVMLPYEAFFEEVQVATVFGQFCSFWWPHVSFANCADALMFVLCAVGL